jgi:hypothetical protein
LERHYITAITVAGGLVTASSIALAVGATTPASAPTARAAKLGAQRVAKMLPAAIFGATETTGPSIRQSRKGHARAGSDATTRRLGPVKTDSLVSASWMFLVPPSQDVVRDTENLLPSAEKASCAGWVAAFYCSGATYLTTQRVKK